MAGGASTILAGSRSESVVTRLGNLRAREPPSRSRWKILMMRTRSSKTAESASTWRKLRRRCVGWRSFAPRTGTSSSYTSESLPEESQQMIKEIAFTGSSVTDMKRARAFYEDVLGLKPSEEMAGVKWIEYEVGGGVFAITNIDPTWTPSNQGTAVAFEVDAMDPTI